MRCHLYFVAKLAINGLGVAAVIGILFALMTGQDYHSLVFLAACIFLLLRPLLSWIARRYKRDTGKDFPS